MTGVDGQLRLGGMPTRLYSCTPSRLNTWWDCPRRYRMTYLERPSPPKGPPWAHNSVGVSIHNALVGWWRLPRERRTTRAAGDLLDAGWLREGFRDDEQRESWRRRARGLVERYVADLDPDDEPVGVERVVATRTSSLAVSGRVDRIDQRPVAVAGAVAGAGVAGAADDGAAGDGDELVIVDYKTGRRPLSADDARTSLALAIYAVAAGRTLRRRCRRVELHHLPTGEVHTHEHTDASLQRHLDRAASVAADAAAADQQWRSGLSPTDADEAFPASPGPICGWCDYSRHCPVGRAAAAPRRSWDGLADD